MGNQFSSKCCPAIENKPHEELYIVEEKKFIAAPAQASTKEQTTQPNSNLSGLPSQLPQVSKFADPPVDSIPFSVKSELFKKRQHQASKPENLQTKKDGKQSLKDKFSVIHQENDNPEEQKYESNGVNKAEKNMKRDKSSEFTKKSYQFSLDAKIKLRQDSRMSECSK